MNSFMNIKLWIVYSQTYFDVSEDELGCWQLRWRQTNLPTSHPRQPSTDPSQDWLRTCKEEGTGQEESRGRGRKYFLLDVRAVNDIFRIFGEGLLLTSAFRHKNQFWHYAKAFKHCDFTSILDACLQSQSLMGGLFNKQKKVHEISLTALLFTHTSTKIRPSSKHLKFSRN